jgi:hypothetical protein
LKKVISVTAIAIFILLIGFVFLSRQRDELQIRRSLVLLQELLEKSSDEPPIAGLGKAKKVGKLFIDDCRIKLGHPVPDINGRSELEVVVQQARKSVYEVSVRFADISVSVSNDRTGASVSMTATATVRGAGEFGSEIEACEVEMAWVKTGGSWKIEEVHRIKAIR